MKRFSCKATALLTVACFICSGIPVSTAFASVNELTLNEAQRPVATVTLEQANAQPLLGIETEMPSGVAVQNPNPLSAPSPESVIVNGDFSQKTSGSSLPDGWSPYWTTAESVPGYLSSYDGKTGVVDLSLSRAGRGMKQTYSIPVELDRFSLFEITFKIVSATLAGDGSYGIESPVIFSVNVLRDDESTYQTTRYFNFTHDTNSTGNAKFVLVPQNQWVTRSFTAQDLGLKSGDKLTEIDVLSGGWAREAYVDSVGVYLDQVPPVTISFSGVEAELPYGTDMTVTVVTNPPVDSYRWFLDGALIPGATTPAVTVGKFLTTGDHTLTVETTLGGVVTSQSAPFQVIDFSQYAQLDIADQYALARTAHLAEDISTFTHSYWDPSTGTSITQYYPITTTAYGYGDSLQLSRSYAAWHPPAQTQGHTYEDRALVEFDLSRWYQLGFDPAQIARVELLATVSGSGEIFQGYDFSINSMQALEDGIFSSAQDDFNVSLTSLQTVHNLQLNSTSQDLRFNITDLLRNDLVSGDAWSGIVFKAAAANLSLMQLANLRLKVYYDTDPNVIPPAQPVVTSSVPAATDQTTLTLSGNKEANTSIWINNAQVVALDDSTIWAAAVSLPVEGNNQVNITAKNASGLVSAVTTFTILRDTVAPTGSININSGAMYATSRTVILNLSGADGSSGISAMSFSTDGSNWTTPETYAISKSLILPAADGNKTVLVKYYDAAGNVSAVYSKSILLDTTPPSGALLINGGAAYTGQTSVTLNLSFSDAGSGITSMSLSTDGMAWSTPVAYAPMATFALPAGDGVKTVYVKCYDKAGNVSTVYSKSIVLEEIQQPTPDSEDLYAWRYNFGQLQGNGITVSQTSPGIYTYHKVASYSWVGGAVAPAFNGNDYDYVTLEARSIASGTNSFVFEVKNGSTYILRPTVSLQGTGWHTFQFIFPKNSAPINFIAFSNPTNDFEIRDLRFSDTPVFTGTASVLQTSPMVTNALNYQLIYTLNGVSFQEALLLKEGNNTVTRTWVNASGKKASYSFSVLADTKIPTGTININSGAAYVVSQTVTLNLSGTDSGSGISTMSFSTDGTNWTAPAAYAASKTFTLPARDGAKTVYVKYFDKAGNASVVYSKSILLDMTPPAGAININSGAVYASSATVTLNLSGADAGSGIAKMSFSTNGTTWTTAGTYAATKTFTLLSSNGNKTVYVKYYDKAGNVSAVYSKSIVLDTLPPVGTVKVNGGAAYINQTAVTLDLSATDAGSGLSQMSFSSNGTTWSTAEEYAATKAWTFSTGDGAKKVYVKFKDKAGKWSTAVSVTVTLDTVKPAGSININSGAAYAASQTVTLNLSGTDSRSGISAMSFSSDNINWTSPVAYATSKTFTLLAGEGFKTVYVKYFDKAGNASVVYSKSIILDALPPAGTVSVNGGAAYISQTAVTLGLSASDAGSGLSKMSFSTNGTTWTTAENYAATKAWTFTAGDGAKKVYVKFQDKSGKWSSVAFVTVTLDTVKPAGTVSINNGAASAPSSLVTLNLTGYDAGSGVDQMHFSADGGATWSNWEAFSAEKSFTLLPGNGTRQVQGQLRDKAGLVSVVFSDSIVVNILVPPGWTQTASNANYCFHAQQEDSLKKLLVLNLGSGLQTEVAGLPSSGEYPRFQDVVDISPDGSTVIYGTLQSANDATIYVQRLSDASKKIASSGVLGPITFISGTENVLLDFQDGKSLLVRLPAAPSALPQILEEIKPNGVRSYFNSSDGALERVAVQQAGATDPLPAVEIVRPVITQAPNPTNQWTLKFDQAMRGVLYEIQFRTSLMSGDWQWAGEFVADRYGEISWQDPVPDRGSTVFYRVVAKEMTTAADLLAQINLLYFDPAFGMIETTHGYPLEGWIQRDKTQPSNFGFYAYLLATIAAGDLVTSTISKTEAISRLNTMMDHLLVDQADPNLGFMGLLPWLEYTGSDWQRMEGSYGHQVSFEDNTNFTNALAVAYGALLDETLAGNSTIHGNGGLLGKINAFIANQEIGYSAMYNPSTNTFAQTMQVSDRSLAGGIVLFGAESSAPLLFLILQYGDAFPASAYAKLNFATRTYSMQDLSFRTVVAPFSGAFQMYWPALLMPESEDPDLRAMLETYTDVQLDFANRNAQPGFLSASYDVVADNLLNRTVSAFSWKGDDVHGVWDGGHFRVTSSTNAGIGVAFTDGSKFAFEGSTMQLHYSSTTAVPNAKIEFKKKVGGVLTTVYTKVLSLENTGGVKRTVSFTLPRDGVLGELTEVVFSTSGGGALDVTLHSFDTDRIGYNFPLGINEIALGATVETTPSVYNLGAAYMFRPEQVEALLQGLINDHRNLVSDHGLWEGLNMTSGKVVYEQVFNNVMTFVLGMTGTGPSYMTRYLENKGLTAELESIWNSQTPVSVTGQGTSTNFAWDVYKGTSWKLNESVRASDRQIRITYQSDTTITGAKFDLKYSGSGNVPVYSVLFDLPATGGVPGEVILTIPENFLYWYIAEMVVVFPAAEGFPSATITGITLVPPVLLPVSSLIKGSVQPTSQMTLQEPIQQEVPVAGIAPQSVSPSSSSPTLKKTNKRESQQSQTAWSPTRENLNAALRANPKIPGGQTSVSAFEQITKLFREICVKLLS